MGVVLYPLELLIQYCVGYGGRLIAIDILLAAKIDDLSSTRTRPAVLCLVAERVLIVASCIGKPHHLACRAAGVSVLLVIVIVNVRVVLAVVVSVVILVVILVAIVTATAIAGMEGAVVSLSAVSLSDRVANDACRDLIELVVTALDQHAIVVHQVGRVAQVLSVPLLFVVSVSRALGCAVIACSRDDKVIEQLASVELLSLESRQHLGIERWICRSGRGSTSEERSQQQQHWPH